MRNDYLEALASRLTVNAAINLRRAHTHPCAINPEGWHGEGRTFTGLGKWTTLAAIGVENCVKALGLAEERRERHGQKCHPWCAITPLGREMAAYLDANWDSLRDKFRDPPKRDWWT